MTGDQSRREFLVRTCQAVSHMVVGGAVLPVMQGCGSESGPAGPAGGGLATLTATESGGKIVLAIGADSPLATVGSVAQIQYQAGTLLVARTGPGTFTALTATCTHQGCTISGYGNGVYTCPCHGSQFGTDGQVARGPASTPLRQYQTVFSEGSLTITL
jgi:Rieske Fe-S protein